MEQLTFWTQDGSQDRPKMAPRPHQDDLQKPLFQSSFLSSILVRFGCLFDPILDPQIGPSSTPQRTLLSLKRQNSAHGPPRCSKSRPRGTQDRPRVPKNPQDAPRPPQNDPRCPQDAPKRPQIVSRCLQDPLTPFVFLCFLSLSLSLLLFHLPSLFSLFCLFSSLQPFKWVDRLNEVFLFSSCLNPDVHEKNIPGGFCLELGTMESERYQQKWK